MHIAGLRDTYFIVGDDLLEERDANISVVPYCAPKWRELGAALGMESHKLNIIEVDYPNSCVKRCQVMLQRWKRQDVTSTWGKLVDAVDNISNKSVSIGGGTLTQSKYVILTTLYYNRCKNRM